MQCPIDRKPTPVVDGDAQSLTVNFALVEMLRVLSPDDKMDAKTAGTPAADKRSSSSVLGKRSLSATCDLCQKVRSCRITVS